MVSDAASCLKAAAAIAVFAVLVMSSQGHPRKKPLCSDCASQCYTNCTAVAAEKCSSYCSAYGCEQCRSQVLQACCPTYCPNDCMGGDCSTCSCDNCNSGVQNSCTSACSTRSCDSCKSGFGQQCNDTCMSDCNDHCVKKDC